MTTLARTKDAQVRRERILAILALPKKYAGSRPEYVVSDIAYAVDKIEREGKPAVDGTQWSYALAALSNTVRADLKALKALGLVVGGPTFWTIPPSPAAGGSCEGDAYGDGYPGTRYFHRSPGCPGHD